MGELDDLMIMMVQVRRRLSRGHQWREVWSGADKVTSWLKLDELVVDKERQSQMRRKELPMLDVDGDVEERAGALQSRLSMKSWGLTTDLSMRRVTRRSS